MIKSLCLNTLFELITTGTDSVVADIFAMDPAKLLSPLGFLIFLSLWTVDYVFRTCILLQAE